MSSTSAKRTRWKCASPRVLSSARSASAVCNSKPAPGDTAARILRTNPPMAETDIARASDSVSERMSLYSLCIAKDLARSVSHARPKFKSRSSAKSASPESRRARIVFVFSRSEPVSGSGSVSAAL